MAPLQANAGPALKAPEAAGDEWVKPGTIIGRVMSLHGEDELRPASLQDFREEG
ncbi:hypothetical protein [Mesorhizobium sp. INR15]|uniref:hypothetical protein n=1 Tax=Mesorhizobium sp. INR15 TaxID=2654248 RepID=UPI0018968CF5|nr:hypothetical protein [Mesorhizobium sp. INR15]